MSPELLGVEMTPNVRTWQSDQRRVGSILALGLVVVLLVAAVVTFLLARQATAVYWTLLALVALLLVFEVVLMVLPARAAHADAEHHAHLGPASHGEVPAPEADPAPRGPRTLTLRCGECGTVFDLTDTGERPLYHACPGCGAEGVLRDEAAPSSPAPAAYAPPHPEAVEPAAPAEPAPVAAPAAPMKRLKLRCGGCKEVFVIEDNGERPLRRPCPYCSRMGEVR